MSDIISYLDNLALSTHDEAFDLKEKAFLERRKSGLELSLIHI